MDEVALYNLHATAAGAGHAARVASNNYAEDLMIHHLHLDHKMGMRDLAKRFGRKVIEIKKVLYPHLVAPEPDWDFVKRCRKRGRKVCWDFEKKQWYTKPIKA